MQTQPIETLREKLERYYPKQPTTQHCIVRQTARRGMTRTQPLERKTLAVGSRVYFFDIKTTSQGTPYLIVAEVRKNVRSSIMVFAEDAQSFLSTIQEMGEKLE